MPGLVFPLPARGGSGDSVEEALAPRGHRTLIILLILALAVRLTWWVAYVGIIENEGVEYTRLAWNWFHGRGYVSIFGGTHTLFPPLYPLLIGVTTPLAGSGEAAARLVSLLGGLAVVGAGYLAARRVFGDRVALLAGAVLALHPVLIALSVSTYSESLYLGLALTGTLAVQQAVSRASWRAALLAGFLAGCAYLARPEGIILALGFSVVILVGLVLSRHRIGRAAGYALVTVLTAAVVGSPYAWHLSRIAGAFRWEGKSALNNRLVLAVDEGMSLREAGRGLGPNGEPRGAWLFQDQHALLGEPAGSSKGLFRNLMQDPVGRTGSFIRPLLRARHLGSPLLVPLVIAGLVLTGWWKQRAPEGLALVVLPAVTVAVMMGVRWNWPRYYFPLLGTGLVWAVAGTERLARAASGLTGRLGWVASARQDALTLLLAGGVLAALVAQSARYLPGLVDISQTRNRDVRLAGEMIRADAARRRPAVDRPLIATGGLAVAHYASGEVVYLPYADEARSLLFLRQRSPHYLVLMVDQLQSFPYAAQWVERGPASCAEPLSGPEAAAIPRVKVWRWTCSPGESLP